MHSDLGEVAAMAADGPGETPPLPSLAVTVLEAKLRPAGADFGLEGWPTAAIRGALGRALRARACTTGMPRCAPCPEWARCRFGRQWEGGAAGGVDIPSGYRGGTPAPYVVMPAGREADGSVWIHLKLVGEAGSSWSEWVLALREAVAGGLTGGRRRGTLEEVLALSPDGDEGRGVYTAARGFVVPGDAALHAPLAEWAPPVGPLDDERGAPKGGWTVDVELLTPLCASKREPLSVERLADPRELTRAVGRRLSLLSRLYGGGAWDPRPHYALAETARSVQTALSPFETRRVSERGQHPRAIPLSGLHGRLRFEGVQGPLARLWSTASVIHAGRDVVVGFGALQLRAVTIPHTGPLPVPVADSGPLQRR